MRIKFGSGEIDLFCTAQAGSGRYKKGNLDMNVQNLGAFASRAAAFETSIGHGAQFAAGISDDASRLIGTAARFEDLALAAGTTSPKPSRWRRLLKALGFHVDRGIDKLINPKVELQAAYDTISSKVQELKEASIKVNTHVKQAEMRISELNAQMAEKMKQAEMAKTSGDQETARLALAKYNSMETVRDKQAVRLQALQERQKTLNDTTREYENNLAMLSIEIDGKAAEYDSERAILDATRIATGVGGAGADLKHAMERIDGEISAMKGESAAIDQMTKEGVLTNVLTGDPVEAQIRRALNTPEALDAQLEALFPGAEGAIDDAVEGAVQIQHGGGTKLSKADDILADTEALLAAE